MRGVYKADNCYNYWTLSNQIYVIERNGERTWVEAEWRGHEGVTPVWRTYENQERHIHKTISRWFPGKIAFKAIWTAIERGGKGRSQAHAGV